MSESIPSELLAAARARLEDPRLARVIAEHCPGEPEPDELDLAIEDDCQMLRHSLKAHGDANLAVSQYFGVALQQYTVVRQLVRRIFEHPDRVDFLDFACGYGRLLRFLIHDLPPERLRAAEILPGAVAWCRARYGVETWRSAAEPADFRPGRRFDMIWAASLFSHLPDELFRRWVARLAALLEPGGVLAFSVHDQAILPEGMTVAESGLCYLPASENDDLDPAIYGTTYVTADYVLEVLREAFGPAVRVERLPRLLAHEQDVYVATADGDRSLEPLAGFRRGTRGWLDELDIDAAAGTVRLQGWAGSLDDEVAFDHVLVRLEEREWRQPVGRPRPEVARVLGHPGLADSGFETTLELPASERPYLSLSAVAADGERALIYAGPLTSR
jgi:SAM-dependent methyltransferase